MGSRNDFAVMRGAVEVLHGHLGEDDVRALGESHAEGEAAAVDPRLVLEELVDDPVALVQQFRLVAAPVELGEVESVVSKLNKSTRPSRQVMGIRS